MTQEEAVLILKNMLRGEVMPVYLPEQKRDAVRLALSALRPVGREQLSEFKTCELVDELRKREGVETHIAEPYQDVTVSINGPAVVLVVID